MLLLDLAIFLLFCLIMAKSGTLIVSTLSNVATLLRIREFTLAFVVMAISTSLPDLAVGITAALQGSPEIILGAVIGANIIDISLVIGIAVILSRGINLEKREEVLRNAMWLIPIASLPVVLFFIGNKLSRTDGIMLILVFLAYMYFLIKEGRHLHDDVIRKDDLRQKLEEKRKEAKRGNKRNISVRLKYVYFFMKDWMILAAAIVALVVSASYAVKYARILSIDLNLPEILIGFFILALGNTLPELVFEISAVLKNRRGLLLGDPMGSIVINSTLVLGVVSLIHPIEAPFILFMSGAIFMLLLIFVFAIFVETEKKLTVKEGIILLLLYALFIFIELSLKGAPGVVS